MSDLQSFSIKKHPSAEFAFGIDYSNDLAADEEISSVSVTAIDLSDGSPATSIIIDGPPQIQDGEDVDGNVTTNTMVVQQIKAGSLGKSYKITVIAIRPSNPKKLPTEIKLDVLHGVKE